MPRFVPPLKAFLVSAQIRCHRGHGAFVGIIVSSKGQELALLASRSPRTDPVFHGEVIRRRPSSQSITYSWASLYTWAALQLITVQYWCPVRRLAEAGGPDTLHAFTSQSGLPLPTRCSRKREREREREEGRRDSSFLWEKLPRNTACL